MPDFTCSRERMDELFGRENVNEIVERILAEHKAETVVDPELEALLEEYTKTGGTAEKFAKLECDVCDSMPCRFCKLCTHKRGAGRKHRQCSFCTEKHAARLADAKIYHCDKSDKAICSRCSSCKKGCKCVACPNAKCKKRLDQTEAASRIHGTDGCNFCFKPELFCQHHNKWADFKCTDCQSKDCDCTCGAVEDVGMSDPEAKFHKSNSFVVNPSRRYISAEIEVCGFKNNTVKPSPVMAACKKYGSLIHGDGSLPSGGKEINTAPANGDMLLKILRDTYDAIGKQAGFVGREAGSHIHINVHDLTGQELQRVALVYATLEETLFKYFAPDRSSSNYCKPTANKLRAIYENIEVQTASDFFAHAMRTDLTDRYHALNLTAYQKYNTLECRMLGPTVSYDTMARWVMIWGDIMDFALSLNLNQAKAIAKFQKNGPQFLASIIRNKDVRAWFCKTANVTVPGSGVAAPVAV